MIRDVADQEIVGEDDSPPALFGTFPILAGESKAVLQEVRVHFLDALQPMDAVEVSLVDDIVQIELEIRRYRKMEAAWLEILRDDGLFGLLQRAGKSDEDCARLVESWKRGEPNPEIDKILARLHFDQSHLDSSTVLCSLEEFTTVRGFIMQLVKAKARALRTLEARQRARRGRNRSLNKLRPVTTERPVTAVPPRDDDRLGR